MQIMEKLRAGGKLLGTASVQMMIGGVVQAVVPPQVSVIYKAAITVGSCLAAMAVSKSVDGAVDETFDNLQAVAEQTKHYIEVLREKEETVSNEIKEE